MLIRAKLGPNHEVIPCEREEFFSWAAEHLEKESGDRVVGEFEERGVSVSTVFLGINHNFRGNKPLWFETMVFGGALDREQRRYSTWEEAERGHAEMVARVLWIVKTDDQAKVQGM